MHDSMSTEVPLAVVRIAIIIIVAMHARSKNSSNRITVRDVNTGSCRLIPLG